MLEDILGVFLTACAQDANLRAFAEKRRVSIQFTINDEDATFWLAFGDGTLQTGVGSSPAPVDLEVRMDADTFDRVMTGRLDGSTAAFSGKLRFHGQPMKGMALQRITGDMIRLYTQAREESGAAA